MSENTINAALRRMGFAKDEMTGHGFRAVASTLLNECGKWNADAIEAQLAHVENDAVRRAYHRADYWAERVAMMIFWADFLDDLHGSDLRDFLTAQQPRKQPCRAGEIYCIRCRAPKRPAGDEVERIPKTPTTVLLRGICPPCDLLIHRLAKVA